MKIIITGSEGLIGKQLQNHLQKKHKILKLDISLGHDLTDEKFVISWFKKNIYGSYHLFLYILIMNEMPC